MALDIVEMPTNRRPKPICVKHSIAVMPSDDASTHFASTVFKNWIQQKRIRNETE